jgi:hypothetical protein
MTEEIMKIIKEAGQKRHNNHVSAGKMNWENVRLEAKKEVFDDIDNNLSVWILHNLTEPYGLRSAILNQIDKLKKRHLSKSEV